MFDNFTDYMYYLLTTPYKQVKKSINNWYKLFKVLGRLFDDAKESILRARDESMVTTCSDIMLKEHAADRGLKRYEADSELTRYDGETYDNFRKRIAMYLDVCRLAGTNQGVIKAVKSLGYRNVSLELAKIFRNDPERWAEFYVVIAMSIDDNFQIRFNILKKEVRKNKEVGSKDNYLFVFSNRIITQGEMLPKTISRVCIEENGFISNREIIRCSVINDSQTNAFCRTITSDCWYFDGSYLFDGSHSANGFDKREEL